LTRSTVNILERQRGDMMAAILTRLTAVGMYYSASGRKLY